MREIEITQAPVLDEQQSNLLDWHSVFNVLNIVLYDVEDAGSLVDDDDGSLVSLVEWVVAEVAELRKRLADSRSELVDLRRLTAIRRRLCDGLIALRPRVRPEDSLLFARHLHNLESIFDVVDTRVEELIERGRDIHYCKTFTLAQLRTNLEAVFNAIARNSFGRYRIAFTPETRTPGDYLMEFHLRSLDGHSVCMPAVLEDVMRDLAANARKYTEPGGWVRLTLVEEVDDLSLEVEDNGHGIPEDEIEKVVGFGRRGTNFEGRAQAGGGFGLTKAYTVMRELGGRMWIRSGLEEGTCVRIRVPRLWAGESDVMVGPNERIA